MGKHSQLAIKNFKDGYNCSQAVFLAYAKDFGLNEKIALKLSSSFGGGMGKLREVCGAVTAIFAVAGLKYGYTDPNDDTVKQKHYELIQKLATEFKNEHNSIICRELLGVNGAEKPTPTKRTPEFYQTRPCIKFIETACEILDKFDKKL